MTTFSVSFSLSGRIIACDAQSSILRAARLGGLRLPFSCGRGICGTCKRRLLAGTVDMAHQGGIGQAEIDDGMILVCCSKPLSDLVIDY
ncbi:MAG TPA: 2Fe-2S iron-sulfur cluster-binding protein [Rhizomicrobium sp.]